MTGPHDKVTRNGQVLTQRAWDSIYDAAREVGLAPVDVQVGQGGFKGGNGASASAGTHDRGDVADIRVVPIPQEKWVPLVVALRRRGWCAWLRSAKYGWVSTGPHIHAVLRDSFYPLSPGARQQVESYDHGGNGLANDAPDPFPRPKQYEYTLPLAVVVGTKPLTLRRAARVLGVGSARLARFNKVFLVRRPRPGEAIRIPPGGNLVPRVRQP